MKKFEFLEHTADIKIRVFGKDIEKIFENSADALSHLIGREKKIKSVISKKIKVKGTDRKNLLLNFLDELIYQLDARNFIVSKTKVKMSKDGNKLEAQLIGDKSTNYDDLDYVKAATYHEMYIKEKTDGWEAQFVIDV